MLGSLKGAWHYRHFIWASIRNEMVSRFIRSRLGGAWMVIHPLSLVLTYALILSAVLSAKLPGIDNQYAYAIYLTGGMLGWTLFMEVINRCLGMFIENGNLMKKMVFPKVALPIIAVGGSLINNVILFLVILIVFACLGHFGGMELVWVPVLTLLTLAFAAGVGLVLGVLNVFIRDIGQVMPIILQFLFWFTPVVYPISIVPESLRKWMDLNPLYHLIAGYHDVLVYGKQPELGGLVIVALLSAIFLFLGLVIFRKASPEMVDAL
ncbi:ABC transporter permease [Salinicola sp. NYA28a]